MLTGKDLIERGWPQAPAIGLALDAAEGLGATGMDDDAILRELEKVKAAPDSVPDKALEPLTRELTRMRDEETAALEDKLRGEALPYGVWGADLIEAGTTAQMEAAMRLPVSVGGAPSCPTPISATDCPSAAFSPQKERSSPGPSAWT